MIEKACFSINKKEMWIGGLASPNPSLLRASLQLKIRCRFALILFLCVRSPAQTSLAGFLHTKIRWSCQTILFSVVEEKYPVSLTQIRKDIALAKELFKTQHTFDWDLWHIWELKDQLDLIKRCRDKEDFKNWNAAKKHLRDILGSKPEAVEDPRRMEKNVFYIQVNNGTNQQLNIPLDTIRSLSADDRRIILENMSEPLDEADADQIFDS